MDARHSDGSDWWTRERCSFGGGRFAETLAAADQEAEQVFTWNVERE